MTTPREEKSTGQPEISPEAKEAVKLELFGDDPNPAGYHVQQLLNASAAQQREETAALNAKLAAFEEARNEAQNSDQQTTDEVIRLQEENATLRTEIAALHGKLDTALAELAKWKYGNVVERLRADLETEREIYQALRREKDQQARQAGSELVALSGELTALRARAERAEKERDEWKAMAQGWTRLKDFIIGHLPEDLFRWQEAMKDNVKSDGRSAPAVEVIQSYLWKLWNELSGTISDRDALRTRLEAMRGALEEAEQTFLNYAAMHDAKQPPATQKAKSNRQAAARCRAALTSEAPNSTRKEGDEICAHLPTREDASVQRQSEISDSQSTRAQLTEQAVSNGAPSSDPTDAPEVALPNMPCQMCGGSGYITHGPHGGICSDCHGSGLIRPQPTDGACDAARRKAAGKETL